ncbi:hypothetical protein DNH61_11725 [Paenibacillus sambharensis]|uniref:Uncharacterized protein n=1 Tax=Paenibacillus sambharensis TaxID=1803190 RepID=A0A2W1LJN8_9BACL|nr:hypothetical protein [Paenibacillus sambharensis]PZD95222.1 hypothetical protein DNH61_11725 [Paenibacillus sambharensis]
MIDVKRLLYGHTKLIAALANIHRSIAQVNKKRRYPGCTQQYNDDVRGIGGLPVSQTERFALDNVMNVDEERQQYEWDAEEHEYVIGLVKSALEALDDRQRECIKLCYFQGREPVAASMMMNLSLSHFYHVHRTAIADIEKCLNDGNIFMNRLIPVKKPQKRNKNARKRTAISEVS